MEMLKEMFPQHSEEILQVVLDDNRGDVEQALAVLLSPEFEPRQRSPRPDPAPVADPKPKPLAFSEVWEVRCR